MAVVLVIFHIVSFTLRLFYIIYSANNAIYILRMYRSTVEQYEKPFGPLIEIRRFIIVYGNGKERPSTNIVFQNKRPTKNENSVFHFGLRTYYFLAYRIIR